MTVEKQIERSIEKVHNYHAKTENLIKEIFGLQKKLSLKKVSSVKTAKIVKIKPETEIKARAGRNGGPNKSQLVRSYFEKHGLDSRPKDIIEAIKKVENIEVDPALVSIVKKKLGGVKKEVKAKTPVVAKTTTKTTSALPLRAICLEVLCKNKDGLKLGDLANKVIEAGYKYGGEKGHKGIVQNVFQCLYSLSKEKHHPGFEGTDPVVVHDETSKRYALNPNAKRSA